MSSPTPLPITRAEALERFCHTPVPEGANNDDLVDAMATLFGITFAPEPPAPPEEAEPPAWYGKPIQIEESEETPGFHYLSGAEGEFIACGAAEGLPWLAKSHDRRLGLEFNIEEGWRRSAQIDRATIDEQRERIDALLAELAERTRERSEAQAEAQKWSEEALQQVGYERSRAEAAERERDELRRRCERVAHKLYSVGGQRHVDGDSETLEVYRSAMFRATNELTRPLPDEGGSDA